MNIVSPGTNGTQHAMYISYQIGNSASSPYVGFGFYPISDPLTPFDFSGSTGVTLFHKGSAVEMQIVTTALVDNDKFVYTIPAHNNWTMVQLTWDQFQQLGWGTAVPFSPSEISAFEWLIDGNRSAFAKSGEIWIDQIQIDGLRLDLTKPKAGFTYLTSSLSKIVFTNTSKHAEKYRWDFGDGSTSTQVNPEHDFEPGVYLVKLVADKRGMADSISHTVEIEGIRGISSNKGGNGGIASVIFYGGGLSDNTKVILKNGDIEITGENGKLIAPGELEVEFDLFNEPIGIYDIEITEETTFGKISLTGVYAIEETRQPEVWAEIIGRNVVIANRWQTYTIAYGNKGNVDALVVPLILGFTKNSQSHDIEIEFLDFVIDTLAVAKENNYEFLNLMPLKLPCDTLSNIPFKGEYYPLFIPKIAANYSGEVHIRLRTNQSAKILLDIHNPLFQYSINPESNLRSLEWRTFEPTNYYKECLANAEALSLVEEMIGYVPNAGCLTSAAFRGYELGDRASNWITGNKQVQSWGSWSEATAYTVLGCVAQATQVGYPAGAVLNGWAGVRSRKNAAKDCRRMYGDPVSIEPTDSVDPNEIVGTSGYGGENYIQKKDHLNYTVYFENDPEQATAPAQEIDVRDTLDLTKFNPNDFSFGTFTFRDTTIIATPGVTEFSQDVDMRPKGENIIVRIQGTFNKTTGEVRCYMVAYDPVTMDLTENPNLGILYPNTAPPVGEGNFTYRIGLRQDLPDGTVIENQANITFDLNEPIATNTFVNTLDLSKPASNISPTYQIEKDTIITLSWSGTDSGSGVAAYSVYVSENEGDFYTWLYNVTETTAEFTGKKGSIYRFYVRATDRVGNQEEQKQQAELTVSLRSNDSKNKVIESDQYGLRIIPNPVSDNATIEFTLPASEQVRLSLCSVLGQEVMEIYKGQKEKGINQIPFDAAKLSAGVYILSLQDENSQVITKFMRK